MEKQQLGITSKLKSNDHLLVSWKCCSINCCFGHNKQNRWRAFSESCQQQSQRLVSLRPSANTALLLISDVGSLASAKVLMFPVNHRNSQRAQPLSELAPLIKACSFLSNSIMTNDKWKKMLNPGGHDAKVVRKERGGSRVRTKVVIKYHWSILIRRFLWWGRTLVFLWSFINHLQKKQQLNGRVCNSERS